MSKIKISGRSSDRKQPDLQNIPLRTDLGAKLRAALLPPPSRVLLSTDYSGLVQPEDPNKMTLGELYGTKKEEGRGGR